MRDTHFIYDPPWKLGGSQPLHWVRSEVTMVNCFGFECVMIKPKTYHGTIGKEERQQEKELHGNCEELELEESDPYEQQEKELELHRDCKELELEENDPYQDVIRALQEKQSQERDKLLSSHNRYPRNKRPRKEKYSNDGNLQDVYRNAKEGDEESYYMYCNPGHQNTRYTTSLIHQPALAAECSRGVMQMEVHLASGIKESYMLGSGLVGTSPYVLVKYGHDKKELRSSVSRGGGSRPSWHETFFYNVMNPAHRPPLLHIEVWDKFVARKDKLIGRVSIYNILEYVCKNPFMCTQHMWLPIFYHRKKDYDIRETGKLLVRIWFETKDPTYFGDARWRDDHTYSKSKERKCVDLTAACIEPKYRILTNIFGLQYAGTVIRLSVNDLQ